MPQTTKDRARRRSDAVRWALLNPSRRQLSKWQRQQRVRLLVALSAVAMALLIFGVLGFGYLREVVLPANDTVAVVHGEQITARELMEMARPTYNSVNRQAEELQDRGLAEQAGQLRLQLAALPSQVLNYQVEQRLIEREAQARGLSVSEEEVNGELRERMELETALQATPSTSPEPSADASPSPLATLTDDQFQTTYQGFLSRSGLEDEQFRRLLRESLLRDEVREAIQAELPTSGEQVRARHILLSEKDKANEILKKLQEGASFEELAKAESTDPGTKDKGGDLGWFPRGVMNEAFETAAFQAQAGAGPQILESPNGWHVLEVLEKSRDRAIENDDLDLLKAKRFQDWLTQARQAPEVKLDLSSAESEWVIHRLQGRIF